MATIQGKIPVRARSRTECMVLSRGWSRVSGGEVYDIRLAETSDTTKTEPRRAVITFTREEAAAIVRSFTAWLEGGGAP